ncbi:LOW QUALITY PROTEIN: receptor-type tyrosine-protein phosphatase eta [Astyanax mexicanus]|uniref:LOW QUALITY PROTEIN: receptor-type tyrosine-protein phosphatase eta n=1 Tax=Astyanax mexicanus TaxID=7994 RepID=UPI0020CAACDD|nr:LOW QUALITY PROTEIN: receptor-type tyrosine-protein phosphatase eta [Astyanax mexicanus]
MFLKKHISFIICLFTEPDAVANLIVSNISTSSVLLTWELRQGYNLFYKVELTNGTLQKTFNTTKTSLFVPNLIAGVNYTFTVSAVAGDNVTEGDKVPIPAFTSKSCSFLTFCVLKQYICQTYALALLYSLPRTHKPDAVANLIVCNISTSSVLLTWELRQGYNLFYKVEELTNGTLQKTFNTTNTSLFVPNLIAGVNYTFTVSAVAGDNVTEGDKVPISAFTNPDVVIGLSVLNKNTSSVSLTWNAPHGNSSFYIVKWTVQSVTKNDTTSNTSYTITGLTAGVNYTFDVAAVAADNVTVGDEVLIPAFTEPDVIQNLTVVDVTTSSVKLNWIKPVGESSYYRVKYENFSMTLNKTTDNTTISITNRTPGVQNTFRVSAVAADNITEGQSVGLSVYTSKFQRMKLFRFDCVRKPDVVQNLTVVDVTTSSVKLNWIKPVGESSYYRVQYDNLSMTLNKTTDNTMISISNRTPGVQYTFRVSAVAADNITEGQSVGISVYTKPDVVQNLTVVDVTTSSVKLNWIKPVGESSYYRVQYDNLSMTLNKTTDNTMISISNRTPGVQYAFRVSAVAADNSTEGQSVGLSVYTSKFQRMKLSRFEGVRNFSLIFISCSLLFALIEPDVIQNLTVVDVTTSSVTLNWIKPVGESSYYRVQYENFSMTLNKTTENTVISITNRTPGVQYAFRVSAVAADNITEGQSVGLSVYTKPDVVQNLTVVDVTTSSVKLNWIKPVGESSYYRVQYDNLSMTLNKTTENTVISISNRTPGVQYTFRVSAVAADNSTEGQSVGLSVYTKPEVIRNLIVTEITTNSLFINWTEPIGQRYFFKVQWTRNSVTFNTTPSKTTTNTSFIITDLTAGVNYSITVSAVAADNITEGQSVGISVYTSKFQRMKLSRFEEPDIIRNLISNISNSSVSLTWTGPVGESSLFRVLQMNGTESWNKTIKETQFSFPDLTPGSRYNFTVSAIAADNVTEGKGVDRSICTNVNPVFNYSCNGPDCKDAVLNFKWTTPFGNNQGFCIGITDGRTECKNDFSRPDNNHSISDLQYDSFYTVTITTLGCGQNSSVKFTCKTGITYPTVPNTPVNVTIHTPVSGQKTATVQFSRSLLNGSKGRIEAYGILLSTDAGHNSNSSDLNYTYSDWNEKTSKTYVTVLKQSDETTRSDDISVEIGDEQVFINGTNYKNGPLTANTQYRVAIILFTRLKINNGLVDISQSVVSITPFAVDVINIPYSTSYIGIIVGLVCFFILLIVAAVVFIKWRRQTKKNDGNIPITTIRHKVKMQVVKSLSVFFSTHRSKINISVRIEEYEDYFRKQQADSNCGFAEEYEDLKIVGTAQAKSSALAIENKGKNRYNNVLPYDSSRVKLSPSGSPFDDYINANYIAGYNSKKEYIAAQGPLPATVNEFWRMIWEKHVHTIVMLTRCNEQGRVKCEKYWPSQSKMYNNLGVTNTSEIPLEDWTISDFTIKNVKTAETRQVRHFHFTAWPDHGVPETTEVLINFRHLVREHMDQYSRNSPTVVHCSAGVGRTGTFIALDHLIFQIERDSMVDIFGIVYDMRMHRTLMVQTEDQYVFLNQCAVDIIKSRMGTNVDLIYQNAAAFSVYGNL